MIKINGKEIKEKSSFTANVFCDKCGQLADPDRVQVSNMTKQGFDPNDVPDHISIMLHSPPDWYCNRKENVMICDKCVDQTLMQEIKK